MASATYALRQLEAMAGRLRGLREPVGEAGRRCRLLAGRLARMSESRNCPAERARLLFVAADRLGQWAWQLAQAEAALPATSDQEASGQEASDQEALALERECARAGPEAQRVLEEVAWRMSLLALECGLQAPEKVGLAAVDLEEAAVAGELEQLARDVSAIWTSWRVLAADAAWAAREAAGRR